MKKSAFIILLISAFSISLRASHIVGGEVAYTYMGPGASPGTSHYSILLRLFTECGQICGGGSGVACPPTNPIIGIFVNSAPYSRVSDLVLTKLGQPQINLTTYPPCLDTHPTVCYQVNTYSGEIDLTDNAVGYRIAYQSCCRAANINVRPNAGSSNGVPGAAYEATLPGTNIFGPAGHNSSALVDLKDTALVCHDSYFILEFSAVDADGDSLSYAFAPAYDGGSFIATNDGQGPDVPLYNYVVYQPGYSGTQPLGSQVTINPTTGVISGIAPSPIGKYVVNVIVREWRNGIVIAEHRKDFLVRTNDCTLTRAQLSIIPTTCDGNTVDFSQYNSSSGNITSYRWIFGDPASGSNDTAYVAGPTHFYATPGVYTVRLRVASGNLCIDSTSQQISVYPGFKTDFNHLGYCVTFPINFQDNTFLNFGSVNSWSWNFGEPGSANNTANTPTASHTYAAPGTYDVTLKTTSTKGCIDSITKKIDVLTGPPLGITPDTTICQKDTLQITATGTGSVVWSPNYMINNINSPTPLVSPDVTTVYHVRLTDAFGCHSDSSVTVNVVDSVIQFSNYDTTICQTDAIVLRLNSNALYFSWTPADGSLNNTSIKNPTARPLNTTVYTVRGSISNKCFADNTIRVKVVPYPVANAGPDIPLCFGSSTQLHATGGVSYSWSPAVFLSNPRIANPQVTRPTAGVRYVVTVIDTLGCPKPGRDTVLVNVTHIIADAGPSDTSVVLGQPLQLHATGGSNYSWSPITWLDVPTIADPVSRPQNNIRYVVTVSDASGCFARDSINVHVYFMKADILVPNAFTPNGDGNNDIFRPILIGMKSLDKFAIFNRWGQQVYYGTGKNVGWDGTLAGRPQDMATYVWYAEGVDFMDTVIKRKGYMVLVR